MQFRQVLLHGNNDLVSRAPHDAPSMAVVHRTYCLKLPANSLNRTYKEVAAEELYSFSAAKFCSRGTPLLPRSCEINVRHRAQCDKVIEARKVHTPENGQSLAGYVDLSETELVEFYDFASFRDRVNQALRFIFISFLP